MWTNQASSCCACCAPGDQPAPPCVRNVTGTVTCPPDMYRCFAAWLMICSVASVRKSSYMISATGRMPWSAAPIAAPASAISEIGVLRTRSRPNSSSIPCVTPIEPPISAMSSPMTKTSSSCRIACTSASRTASRYESSGIDVLQVVLGRGIGAVLRELDRGLDDLRHLGVELVELLVRDAELLPQQHDRIAGRAEPAGLLLVAVHLRVADVVAGEALGVEVDEDGPLAGARVLERLPRGLVDRLDVLAVGLQRLHAERLGALREIAQRCVLRLRRRLGPLVVLEHEDGGNAPELREVERLVEGADVRRAVAEEGERDARLAAHLEGERGAGHLRQAAADHGVGAHVPALDVVEMHRAAVAVRAPLLLAVELGHHLVRVRPLRERVPVCAMSRGDHVALLERAADTDGAGFLADGHVQEAGQLAGAEALLDLLLEAADEQHLAQRVEKVALRECRLRFHLRHGAQSMVRAMALVDQWNSIESGLDPRWSDARLMLTVGDDAARDRAAALLAPAGPGRSGRTLRFYTARGGAGVGPEAIRTMLRRIDAERIDGTLELVSSDEAPPVAAIARPSLAAEWDAARAALPTDWSEVLCELELTST